MRNVDDAVDHFLHRSDAREELSGLLRLLYGLRECLVQSVRTLQYTRSHVVARHVSVHCVANVHQPVRAEYDELAMS